MIDDIIIVEGKNKYIFSDKKEVIEKILGEDYYKLSESEQYERLKLRTLMNATFNGIPARDLRQEGKIQDITDKQYIIWDEETFVLSLSKNNDIVIYEKDKANIFAKGIDKEKLERIGGEYIRINDCANEILQNKIKSLKLENKKEQRNEGNEERI